MARIGAGQPTGDLQPLLVARERAGEIALRTKNIARLLDTDRQVALALGMARIGACQPPPDRQPQRMDEDFSAGGSARLSG